MDSSLTYAEAMMKTLLVALLVVGCGRSSSPVDPPVSVQPEVRGASPVGLPLPKQEQPDPQIIENPVLDPIPEPEPVESKMSSSCVIDGYGKGTCSFSNEGRVKGGKCLFVEVVRVCTGDCMSKDTLIPFDEIEKNIIGKSGVICSGQVEPMSTVTIPFAVPEVTRECVDVALKFNKMTNSEFGWHDFCRMIERTR